MKQMLCVVLMLALLLCGCRNPAQNPSATQGQTENVTEEATETVEETEPAVLETETVDVTVPFVERETESVAAVGETGCVRVTYNGNVSYVRYITSVEQLPDHEAFAAYDEAYFQNKALVLVCETVSSGSVRVEIASMENGVVTLSHEMSGDVGTADMATWLLWAEVEAGLEYTWSVANPALESNISSY